MQSAEANIDVAEKVMKIVGMDKLVEEIGSAAKALERSLLNPVGKNCSFRHTDSGGIQCTSPGAGCLHFADYGRDNSQQLLLLLLKADKITLDTYSEWLEQYYRWLSPRRLEFSEDV